MVVSNSKILTPVGGPPSPEGFTSNAFTFLGQLADAATDLAPPVRLDQPVYSPVSPTFTLPPAPDAEEVSFTLPAAPSSFTGSLDTAGFLPEAFDSQPPELAFGAAPTENFGEVPSAPGVNVVFDDPTLDVNLPAAPELLSLNIEQFSGVSLPEITSDVPEFTVVAPAVREYTPGATYASALLSALQTKLADRIQNGGTGLNPDVEGAIWDRAREREYKQAAAALADLERMEEMGFNMPSGVYMDSRIKIQTELAKNNAGHSREVMIKQAELELDGMNRAITDAVAAENMVIQYANQVEQRAFDSARYATEAEITRYNAQVQAYSAYLDAYKTKIAIYEAQVRGELSRVEAYRAEVAAEQAKAQINQSRVDQFRTLTDAALSAIEVYKAEIAGVQTKADIERLKIQIFGEEIRAYASKVNAYTANVEAYRAAIGAETSKVEAYRSSVQAYGARVEAGSKAVDAKIAEYRTRLQAKELEWQGYNTTAQAEGEKVRAISAKNDAIARIYQAEAGAANGYNEVLARQWSSASQLAINAANVSIEQFKADSDLYLSQRGMVMDAAKVGATVSSQMGAAAISANNFSTSFSTSNSASNSASNSVSDSTSNSTSNNTNKSTSTSDVTSNSTSDSTSFNRSTSSSYSDSNSVATSTSDNTSQSTNQNTNDNTASFGRPGDGLQRIYITNV
jgi:hypothetical protein